MHEEDPVPDVTTDHEEEEVVVVHQGGVQQGLEGAMGEAAGGQGGSAVPADADELRGALDKLAAAAEGGREEEEGLAAPADLQKAMSSAFGSLQDLTSDEAATAAATAAAAAAEQTSQVQQRATEGNGVREAGHEQQEKLPGRMEVELAKGGVEGEEEEEGEGAAAVGAWLRGVARSVLPQEAHEWLLPREDDVLLLGAALTAGAAVLLGTGLVVAAARRR